MKLVLIVVNTAANGIICGHPCDVRILGHLVRGRALKDEKA